MSLQVRFVAKALAATGALVRFLPGVAAPVCLEAVLVVKTLAAAGAVKGFLPRLHVGLLVRDKIGGPIEAFPTVGALIWFLASMDPLVPEETGFIAKALATDGALVRLFPRVDPLMNLKTRLPRETFPTNFALVLPLSFVCFLLGWCSVEAVTLVIGGSVSPCRCWASFLTLWPIPNPAVLFCIVVLCFFRFPLALALPVVSW